MIIKVLLHSLINAIKGGKTPTPSTDQTSHGMYDSNEWIIDTGASNHMLGGLNLFYDLCDIFSPVGLPNGKSTTATKEGKIKLSDGLILEDVYLFQNYIVTYCQCLKY